MGSCKPHLGLKGPVVQIVEVSIKHSCPREHMRACMFRLRLVPRYPVTPLPPWLCYPMILSFNPKWFIPTPCTSARLALLYAWNYRVLAAELNSNLQKPLCTGREYLCKLSKAILRVEARSVRTGQEILVSLYQKPPRA